jgi:23S rRNA (cytidine1920-2'-O)/16S rRNA (cytidine1409-2'-O)-methyltransferase
VSRLCHDRPVNATATPRRSVPSPALARVRVDQLLVDRGLVASRTRAQALLLAGRVRVGPGDTARTDRKAGDLVPADIPLEVVVPDRYVSRGGHKLVAGLAAFGVAPVGRVCLDVGASTGGFTDVLLQGGATRVYAVDVGRGQLAESLRVDPRVVSMERMNARSLEPGLLPEPVDLAVVDVSFISLRLVLGPVASAFGPAGGDLVALVKPQFEAGRGQVPGGVVRDPAVHRATVERVAAAARELGLRPVDVIPSPLLGPEGNREFLLHVLVPGASNQGAAAVPAAPDELDRLATRIAAATSPVSP